MGAGWGERQASAAADEVWDLRACSRPDLSIRIEDLIEEGDKLAARVTASGTNKGELMGSSPTGRAVTWSVVHLSRLEGDRIAEDRVTFNVLGFLQQLGLAPPTAA